MLNIQNAVKLRVMDEEVTARDIRSVARPSGACCTIQPARRIMRPACDMPHVTRVADSGMSNTVVHTRQ